MHLHTFDIITVLEDVNNLALSQVLETKPSVLLSDPLLMHGTYSGYSVQHYIF
jgi:hypothetical protein